MGSLICPFVSDLVNLLAVVSVPALLGEDISAILRPQEDDETVTPYILSPNPLGESFQIMADSVSICETNNLMKAARRLLATFYVFNIAYPKHIMATLTFFQKVSSICRTSRKESPK